LFPSGPNSSDMIYSSTSSTTTPSCLYQPDQNVYPVNSVAYTPHRLSTSPIHPTTTLSNSHTTTLGSSLNYNCSSNSRASLHSPSSMCATERKSHIRRRTLRSRSGGEENVNLINDSFSSCAESRVYGSASQENYPYRERENVRSGHDSAAMDWSVSREYVSSRNGARCSQDDAASDARMRYDRREVDANERYGKSSTRARRTSMSTVVSATSSADVVPPRRAETAWAADSSSTGHRAGFEPTTSCAADSPSATLLLLQVEESHADRSLLVSPGFELCGSELQRSNLDVNGNTLAPLAKPCSTTQNDDDDASMWRPW